MEENNKIKSESPFEEPKNSDKKKDNKKKTIIIVIAAVLMIAAVAFGYVSSQNKKKDDAQKAAFDNVTVEVKDDYSETIPLTNEENILDTKDFIEVLKNGKADKNTKVIKVSRDTIDTSKEGGYTITYTIETIDSLGNKATKDYKKTFTVTNTDEVAPAIKFNKDTVEITAGDTYDPSTNIKSVKDDFDGEVAKTDKKPDESGTAYYVIDASKLDTSKAGEYKVKVTAADKAGNESSKEFTVKVKEKKEESSSDNSSNSSSNKNNINSSSSKNNTVSPSKNNSSSGSNNTSSNKGNTSSGSSSKPQQTCHTVHHDATGHYENVVTGQQWVQDSAAWDEQVYAGTITVCNGCGQEFNTYDGWYNHMTSSAGNGDWSHGSYHSYDYYNTVHHDATGHYENVTSQQWVQDSAAWDEQVCN